MTRIFGNKWFVRAILGASVASAVAAIFLFTRVDSIVNVDLYRFSLQFDSAWYDSYSVYTKAVLVCSGVSAAFSALLLASSFMRKPDMNQAEKSIDLTLSPNLEEKIEQTRAIEQMAIAERDYAKKVKTEKFEAGKTNTLANECPSCGKVFGKALVMLNFVNGKPKMVSTCPYCSQVIEDAENQKSSEPEFELARGEKEEAR